MICGDQYGDQNKQKGLLLNHQEYITPTKWLFNDHKQLMLLCDDSN
jgi:hypothetical protein